MNFYIPLFIRVIITSVILFNLVSCRQAEPVATSSSVDQIVVRMNPEPETLSPILATTSIAREAYQYVFVNLANYDYQTLELKPVLIEKIPDEVKVQDGPYEGAVSYDMSIRPDAVWGNGSPITAKDLLFTLKMAAHPGVQCPGWKQLLKEVIHVEIDKDNPKSFSVYAVDSYFRNKEGLLSVEVYPEHIFDPNGVLSNISLSDIADPEKSKALSEEEAFKQLALDFSSVRYSKELVQGGGPYELESWLSGQYLVLKKKKDYWGLNYPAIDQLQTYPERIVFQFIPDETTALTLLKNDEIDVIDMSKSPYTQFDLLKSDTSFSSRYNFQNPEIPRFLYLMLNNEDVRLSELPVRKAISHLVDVDRLINQLAGGYAKRTNSIIHFSKPEYNKALPFVPFDPAGAISTLEEAGWKDSDGNGVRDKIINGRKEELSLRFHISGSKLSSSLSTVLKSEAIKAGIEIEIVTKPNSATRVENLVTGDFELYVSIRTQHPGKDDPFGGYHSTATGGGGTNYMRYSNPAADAKMELIRETKDEAVRLKAYMDLQEMVSKDMPIVFLYSPQLLIISDKDINIVPSANNPGYFLNTADSM